MAGRRFTRGVARGARRETSWLTIDLVVGGVDGSASLFSSLGTSAIASLPWTIVRTYLNIFVHSDQVVATESWASAVAMAVVSAQAAAIGVTAVPTPITDLESDLFYIHHMQQGRFFFGTGVGAQDIGQSFNVDSKAMRKVSDDEDVILVVEGATQGAGVTISVQGRFLIKEH